MSASRQPTDDGQAQTIALVPACRAAGGQGLRSRSAARRCSNGRASNAGGRQELRRTTQTISFAVPSSGIRFQPPPAPQRIRITGAAIRGGSGALRMCDIVGCG